LVTLQTELELSELDLKFKSKWLTPNNIDLYADSPLSLGLKETYPDALYLIKDI
jgi:hypothetical protein